MSTDLEKVIAETPALDRLMAGVLEAIRATDGVPTHTCISADGERVAYFGDVRIALDPDDWGTWLNADGSTSTCAGASVSMKDR